MQEKINRYPGVNSFTKKEKDVFFGRERDIENLMDLIIIRNQVLLYSKSGIGKSSLLEAGVLPRLDNRFCCRKIRFTAWIPKEKENPEQNNSDISQQNITEPLNKQLSPVEVTIKDLLKDEEKNQPSTILDKLIDGSDYKKTLWYYLKQKQLRGDTKTWLLVFDQFEELFTYPENEINDFKSQIYELTQIYIADKLLELISRQAVNETDNYDALYEPVNVKFLYAIRSDRLDLLNRLSDKISNIQRDFYELKPLDEKQAEDALLRPASAEGEFISSPFNFDNKAKEKIIGYLSSDRKKPIEAFQLQLICQHCENIIINSNNQKNRINLDDLGDLGDLSTIFNRHYENLISQIPEDWQHDVKVLIEDKLIIGGNRVPLPDKVIEDWFIKLRLNDGQRKQKNASEIQQITNEILKITNEILLKLVNSRLLRCEPNTTSGFSYELSHDTLVESILESAKPRWEKEKNEELEKELRLAREKAKREKAELEREAIRQAVLLKLEQARAIEAEKAVLLAKENLENQKIAAKKQRFLLIIMVCIAAVAVVSAIFGFIMWKEANVQTELAKTNENEAKQQKQIVFDFFNKEINSSEDIKGESFSRYFMYDAEFKYAKGDYQDAIKSYEAAIRVSDNEEQKISIQLLLNKTKNQIELLKQAGQLNSQQNYVGAINKYQEIINKNQTDSITIFRLEFAQMLLDGYMVKVPGGTFIMGDNKSGYERERPEHPVKLDTFYMAKYEVTQELYKCVMGENPSCFSDSLQNPVEWVSWYDAVKFCNRLSELMGLKPFYSIKTNENAGGYSNDYTVTLIDSANGFRLPTEAEWEYAGGWSKTGRNRWAGTSDESELKRYANYENDRTIPVDSLQPNPLGLYHMSGNVWEWCWDWYDDDYYQECYEQGIVYNPNGPQIGSGRVLRGGGWRDYADYCRMAIRNYAGPAYGWGISGFRLLFAFQFTSEPGQPGQAGK